MGNFSSEIVRLAQQSEEKYGVPASVTLAQYALESGYGKSYLARSRNNYFGMKDVTSGWQTFDSMAESFDAHGELLSKPLYSSKTAGVKTIVEYVNAIAETYAPSSDGNNDYAGKLLQIIEDNDLTQYDGGNYPAGSVSGTSNSNDLGGIGSKILSAVVKGLAVFFIAILAVVFFMSAFDLKIPSKKAVLNK